MFTLVYWDNQQIVLYVMVEFVLVGFTYIMLVWLVE